MKSKSGKVSFNYFMYSKSEEKKWSKWELINVYVKHGWGDEAKLKKNLMINSCQYFKLVLDIGVRVKVIDNVSNPDIGATNILVRLKQNLLHNHFYLILWRCKLS